ncbi:Uncharacterised protein (plasmid) [Tsukamurella tyrosinosolvens]|uniref:Uncharacterized protein n=1 Tax=Tsukamurella tyrosinosolvens TaxID=57704 RepID=A0A1H4V0C7_TSUTY|nr:hypothetical protein [Tsukamurella tyrosinosolvens]KXO91084.1 hypothetical protein AXK58_21890 [Tsukamurella tyrosinosolvens]SEC74562.1 hypothetical protein SAMN04489793_3102 [Tsukamurella tyrosinosolvens]VEH90757.1 Uncharacterised protein [Tsukamurella tyrosinosolvens]
MIALQILAGVAALALPCGGLTATLHHMYRCTWREAALYTAALLLAFGVLVGLSLLAGGIS